MPRDSWFAYDPEDGLETFDTPEKAREAATRAMDVASDRAADETGWSDDVDRICWGRILEVSTEIATGEHLETCGGEFGCDEDCPVGSHRWDYVSHKELRPPEQDEDPRELKLPAWAETVERYREERRTREPDPLVGLEHVFAEAVGIARLVADLGQVRRATRHPDGERESDTTHSMMLALVALLLAGHERVKLDTTRVLLYALVHDLPEAIAGDVSTLRPLGPEERAKKDEAEREAIAQIGDLSTLLWSLITRYEARGWRDPEARFVHLLDKAMPRITHRWNGAVVPRSAGMTLAELLERVESQNARFATESPDLVVGRAFLERMGKEIVTAWEGASLPAGALPVELAGWEERPWVKLDLYRARRHWSAFDGHAYRGDFETMLEAMEAAAGDNARMLPPGRTLDTGMITFWAVTSEAPDVG